MKIKLNDTTGYFLLFRNNSFLIDFKQYEKFNNDNHCWNEEMDIYPTYNNLMNWSYEIQNWAGNDKPWSKINN